MPGSTSYVGLSNFSQNHIKKKICQYLKAKKRSDRLIKRFLKGYCHGLAVLAAYGQYLNIQTDLTQPCDNWDWMESTLTSLSNWDGQLAHLTTDEQSEIDRLIALVEFYQHVSKYLPAYSQGKLEDYFKDTKDRQMILEYTFAGLLTAADFTQPINTQNGNTSLINVLLKHDHRMIMISSGRHTISLFKNGHQVTLYDSNHKDGLQYFKCDKPQLVIEAIFKAYHYDTSQPSPLGFRVLTFDKQPREYLAPSLILGQLKTPLENEYPGNTKNYTVMHIAARVGSDACANYFLTHHPDLTAEDNDGNTPFDVAMSRRYEYLAWQIRAYPQPRNDKMYQDNGRSSFFSQSSDSDSNIEEELSSSKSRLLSRWD